MLYLIGLGLHDENDISLKTVDALKSCDSVYAELYTSAWQGDMSKLEKLIGKPISSLNREQVESDSLLKEAQTRSIALLIPGDPLVATTHFQFLIDAKKLGVEVKVIHASSIHSAIATCGLHSYKFGRTTTLPFPEGKHFPTSPYEIIEANSKAGLHSLVLLDIPMTIKEGLEILLKMEAKVGKGLLKEDLEVVACTRLGGDGQKIVAGKIQDLLSLDLPTPACLIIPGELSWKEKEALEVWK